MSHDAAAPPRVQLPARLLFRFQLRVGFCAALAAKKPVPLGPEYALPSLAELEGKRPTIDFRLAWHDTGLGVSVEVRGKRKEAWCRENQLVNSDGVRLWINTRPLGDLKRANRFCRQLAMLPFGGGRRRDEPVCGQLAINRAKEQAPVVEGDLLKAVGAQLPDGYRLDAFLDAAGLTGFTPRESPSMGFNYALLDSEIGGSTLSVEGKLPYDEDPSFWPLVELVQDL